MEEDNADKVAEQEAGDGSKPRNGIKTRWEKYKKELTTIQVNFGIYNGSCDKVLILVVTVSSSACFGITEKHLGLPRSTIQRLSL